MKRFILFFALISLSALLACEPVSTAAPDSISTSTTTATTAPDSTATFTPTATLQSLAAPLVLAPEAGSFPAPLNPLTGLPVQDPSLLKLPAILISISHFPATARPQAGLSFAAFVYEFSITEGATRHLAVFHGQFPAPEIALKGDCAVRTELFVRSEIIIGNRVWLDSNEDGRADAWEVGVGGVCVNLLDASTREMIQQTTTDSNGYYGFNVQAGEYIIEFVKPAGFNFSVTDVGDESADSDADSSTGRTRSTVRVEADSFVWDAGLVASAEKIAQANVAESLPDAQVGPVRSGRLVYADIAAFYQNSCLIYAFASEEVLEKLPKCSFVAHEVQGGGFMMELERLREVAEDHARKKSTQFYYVSNMFAEAPPAGGLPALHIDEYWAFLNQSGWDYDALSQSYLRLVDDSTKLNAGILHSEMDRLNGRALNFENIIVIFPDVDVVSSTNLDIHLEQGDGGKAILFRDGMKYDILWSTHSTAYEKQSGLRQPIQFLNLDATPAALRPGSTWVIILTPWSVAEERGTGIWYLRYLPPDGSA